MSLNVTSRPRAPTPAPGRVTNDVHCSVEPNLGFNKEMQDAHVMLDPLLDLDGFGLFAVYDGHGGCDCAGFCSTELHERIAEELRKEYRIDGVRGRSSNGVAEARDGSLGGAVAKPSAVAALRRSFLDHDLAMRNLGLTSLEICGATATVALIVQPDPIFKPRERTLYVANLGDSRAVLCCAGGKVTHSSQTNRKEGIYK